MDRKSTIDAENTYLSANTYGPRLYATQSLNSTGGYIFSTDSSGVRRFASYIGARALAANDGSVFVFDSTIQPISATGQPVTAAKGGTDISITKLVNPLARIDLSAASNKTFIGQPIAMTANIQHLPLGGTLILQNAGVEVTRSVANTAQVAFSLNTLPVGIHSLNLRYEHPQIGTPIFSRMLVQAVSQPEICP
jgi:hypothetical protein